MHASAAHNGRKNQRIEAHANDKTVHNCDGTFRHRHILDYICDVVVHRTDSESIQCAHGTGRGGRNSLLHEQFGQYLLLVLTPIHWKTLSILNYAVDTIPLRGCDLRLRIHGAATRILFIPKHNTEFSAGEREPWLHSVCLHYFSEFHPVLWNQLDGVADAK